MRDGMLVWVAGLGLLLRLLTGLHPYSGAGDSPRYGDYEAQRHWMEVTIGLPVTQWYENSTANDLAYWGLDYPPLTAYQSYLHGLFMRHFDPDSVALYVSRGYESSHSKMLMRWTVVLSDALIFFPAAMAFVISYYRRRPAEERAWAFAAIVLQPALLLIDHGHFQYNCISLGLAVGAAVAVVSRCEILTCFLFCLSLNHKQMSMYYAPAFFAHLLGMSLKKQRPLLHVLKLGVAVLTTFALCWSPFLHSKESALQVLRRLVPIHRGLYEDYVGNFWCVSALLIKWKQLFMPPVLVKLALAATVVSILPSMLQQLRSPSSKGFLFAMFNCSMGFYLFSYQVHEKSVLLPLLPATLLSLEEPDLWRWMMPSCLASMFPLLLRDGLLLPYFSLALLFFLVFGKPRFAPLLWILSLSTGCVLHAAYLLLEPPARYPFLFEAFLSAFAFTHFIAVAMYANVKQWSESKLKHN